MSNSHPHFDNDRQRDHSAARSARIARRALLVGGSLAAAGLIARPLLREWLGGRASVFVARNQRYDGDLSRTIRDGLLAAGLDPVPLRGKRVLLKPNLVEPTRDVPFLTTHPMMVAAAADIFRQWGAQVVVGEAPGHVRDTDWAIDEAGLRDVLDGERLPFADLNYEPSLWRANAGRASKLGGIYFPHSVLDADLVVSLPKLKTHHWVGVTASMKNLYGTLPGLRYGWPKNVLHHAGIPQTVFDINATLPRSIAIVDAIDCMEGDGPIMGTRKPMGLVLIGLNPTAVDSTACRIMGIAPERVSYLALAADRLGPVSDRRILQRGEPWQPLVSPFQILDASHLRGLRAP